MSPIDQRRAALTQVAPTQLAPTRFVPAWLTPTLLSGGIVVAAIALGLIARAPELPEHAGVGPLYPRVPAPPPDLRTLLHLLGVGSVVWYCAAAAFPVLLWGARHLDVGRGQRLRAAAIVIVAAATLFGLSSLLQYAVLYADAPTRPGLAAYLPLSLQQHLLPWVALIGIVAAIEARRRAQRAAVERERLRAQVAEQRLIALTGQLQPHFLFNTLQGISTLIHRDAEAADEMLAKLSDLLRELLQHRDHVLVPLGDELRFTRTYLEIAQLRFSDRLSFAIDAPAELQQAVVPLFILQPLVENALAHGIGGRAAGGRVTVRVSRAGERLRLEVLDDGAGLAGGNGRDGRQGLPLERLGLGNTRERLRASFGDEQSLIIESAPAGGVRAAVEIPYRPLPRATEPR